MEARTRRGTQGVRRKGEQESPENVRQTRRVPGNEEREESEQEVKGPGVHRQEDPLSGEVERLEPDECLVELERRKLAEVARCKEKLRRGQAQQVQEQGRTPARTGRRHLPGQPKQSEALHKAGGEAQQPALALQEGHCRQQGERPPEAPLARTETALQGDHGETESAEGVDGPGQQQVEPPSLGGIVPPPRRGARHPKKAS